MNVAEALAAVLCGELMPTTCSAMRIVLPSSKVTVRMLQPGPHTLLKTITSPVAWPRPEKVALPQEAPWHLRRQRWPTLLYWRCTMG